MIIKVRFRFICSFFLLNSLIACSQSIGIDEAMVKSFFNDTFIFEKEIDEIGERYRYYSKKDKTGEKFVSSLRFFKIQKKHLFKKQTTFLVEPYETCLSKDKWKFEQREKEKIFVIIVDSKIESYVLTKKSKIVSFLYFRKGKESFAHFIPYWELPEN